MDKCVASDPLRIIKLLDNGTTIHADPVLLRHILHRNECESLLSPLCMLCYNRTCLGMTTLKWHIKHR